MPRSVAFGVGGRDGPELGVYIGKEKRPYKSKSGKKHQIA